MVPHTTPSTWYSSIRRKCHNWPSECEAWYTNFFYFNLWHVFIDTQCVINTLYLIYFIRSSLVCLTALNYIYIWLLDIIPWWKYLTKYLPHNNLQCGLILLREINNWPDQPVGEITKMLLQCIKATTVYVYSLSSAGDWHIGYYSNCDGSTPCQMEPGKYMSWFNLLELLTLLFIQSLSVWKFEWCYSMHRLHKV